MSTTAVINSITLDTLTYAPTVLAAVQAIETTGLSGPEKLQAVVSATSQTLAMAPGVSPNVVAIAQLANLFVALFNAAGLFKKKTPAAPVA